MVIQRLTHRFFTLACAVLLLAAAETSTASQTDEVGYQDTGPDSALGAEGRIAADLVSTLMQIESLNPDNITLFMQSPRDTFGASLGHLLEMAGYTIRLTGETPRSADHVEYFVTDHVSQDGVKTYQVNVGSVRVRRDYLISADKVQPTTTMYLQGADAKGLSLNDDIFNLAYAERYHEQAPEQEASQGLQEQPELMLKAVGESLSYSVGDPIFIAVEFNLDALVYCYYQDGHGQIVRVYPNRFNTDNLVSANQNITFPSTDEWSISATRIGASDDFLCIATEPGNLKLITALENEPDLTPLAERSLDAIHQRISDNAGPAMFTQQLRLAVK